MLIPMVLATPKSVAYCRFGNGCKRGRRLFRLCDRFFYGYDLIARPDFGFYGYSHQFDVFWAGYYHEWGRGSFSERGLRRFLQSDYDCQRGAVDLNLWVFGLAFGGCARFALFIVAWLLKIRRTDPNFYRKESGNTFGFVFAAVNRRFCRDKIFIIRNNKITTKFRQCRFCR